MLVELCFIQYNVAFKDRTVIIRVFLPHTNFEHTCCAMTKNFCVLVQNNKHTFEICSATIIPTFSSLYTT